MVWAEIVLHKDVDWSTMAGLNVRLLDRSQHFIPTTWDRPNDCWPRWSNRRYGENRGAQEQEQRTPPRHYEGPMYNDYNYGNDVGSASQSFGGGSGTEYYSGSAPQSFGGGSGSQYYGGSVPQSFGEGSGSQYYGGGHYGTTTNSSNRYTLRNPWETDRGSQNWSSDPWDAYEAYENPRKNPSNLYEDYWNSPRRPLNSYESYRNWPRQEEEYHTPNYAPASYDGYGRSRRGRYNTPPRRVRTRDEEDAQFQRELEEATRRSWEEYVPGLKRRTASIVGNIIICMMFFHWAKSKTWYRLGGGVIVCGERVMYCRWIKWLFEKNLGTCVIGRSFLKIF